MPRRKPCRKGQVRNPLSNRCVKINGRRYHELVRDGVLKPEARPKPKARRRPKSRSTHGYGPDTRISTTAFPKIGRFIEACHIAYYDLVLNGRPTRILLLAEFHELPSKEDAGQGPDVRVPRTRSQALVYADKLRRALKTDGRCLDVYLEDRFRLNTMERRDAGDVAIMTGGNVTHKGPYGPGEHARSMLYTWGSYTDDPKWAIPHRRMHNYDYRELPGDTIAPDELFATSRELRDQVGWFRRLFTSGPIQGLTVDEYLAMYIGVGPQSTADGRPNAALRGKWMSAVNAVRTAYPHWPAPAGLDYMRKIRLRYRKAFSEFQRSNPQRRDMERVLFALRVVVLQAARGLNVWGGDDDHIYTGDDMLVRSDAMGTTLVHELATEAFADIAGFFRMFRVFDSTKHPARGTCATTGAQHNVLWVSHIAHATRLMVLIALVFGQTPLYQDGQHASYIADVLRHTLRLSANADDPAQKIPRYQSYEIVASVPAMAKHPSLYAPLGDGRFLRFLSTGPSQRDFNLGPDGRPRPPLRLHLPNKQPFFQIG